MLPTTFFQVNTEAAEALLEVIRLQTNLQGQEVLVDAYCGIGTLSLPLASQVEQVIGLEAQAAAVEQARFNAWRNNMLRIGNSSSFNTLAISFFAFFCNYKIHLLSLLFCLQLVFYRLTNFCRQFQLS
jgi:predicted RNA methylase